MNTPTWREPPLIKVYLGHAIGTALLGAMLPSGEHLRSLHRLMLPIVELIPNVVRITSRAPDPVFAQTFIGLSLLIAFLILMYFIVAVRGYHTRTFDSTWKRFGMLLFGSLVGISWFWPYLDPISKGKAYFFYKSSYIKQHRSNHGHESIGGGFSFSFLSGDLGYSYMYHCPSLEGCYLII